MCSRCDKPLQAQTALGPGYRSIHSVAETPSGQKEKLQSHRGKEVEANTADHSWQGTGEQWSPSRPFFVDVGSFCFVFLSTVLGMKPRASYILSMQATTELHPLKEVNDARCCGTHL